MPVAGTRAEPKSSICSMMRFCRLAARAVGTSRAAWLGSRSSAGGIPGIGVRKALRRSSGVYSLGGAGLFPE